MGKSVLVRLQGEMHVISEIIYSTASGLRKISDDADFSRPLLLAINSGKMGRRRTAG